jgi:signal transduction histidine kinase
MPKFKQDIDYVFDKVLQGENLLGYETAHVRKDGEMIQVNITFVPILDASRKVISLTASSRDITEQKRASQKLREREQEFRDTVRHQQGIIFKFKRVGNQFIHTLCDGELLYQLKFTPEQVVGKDLYEIHESLRNERFRFIRDYYKRASEGEEVVFEVDFTINTCLFTLKPIIREGLVIEVVGTCIDISKLKKTEKMLQKSGKLAVVGELAAGVAHEIRNPLTTLKGFTQLMASNADPTQTSYIEIMLSELDRIERITNEFMAVAKPQSTTFHQLNLNLLLEQVIQFLNPQALLNNVRIQFTYETDRNVIHCDGNQLKQVFINIIKNALEAMQNGGALEIEVESIEDSSVVIRFTDNGVGIPEDILPKLGEPFYSLKSKGTGLGLTVSSRIIEAHHGQISFNSVLNKGTIVEVKLPLYFKVSK